MKIPDGYEAVMPYLIVKNASAFIDFTKKVFNAELTFRILRDENLVRHAEIKIGGSPIMLADCTDKFRPREATLMVYVENADETYKKAIDEGAEIITELSNQEYGRTGGITDPFGITWWITSVI
jgi:PhnB protein